LIPSIDLMGKKVVQLKQGKRLALSIAEPPAEFAQRFSEFEEVQVIDLDSAMEQGSNLAEVKKICGIVNARVGGGIRSVEKARGVFEAGAKKVIIGTRAEPEFLSKLCEEFGRERVIVALDSREGKVAVQGWKNALNEGPVERAKRLGQYCGEFLYTCIEKEGLMQGPDWATIKRLKSVCRNKISAAGGISGREEAEKLEESGVKAVIGMALYTGKIGLGELK